MRSLKLLVKVLCVAPLLLATACGSSESDPSTSSPDGGGKGSGGEQGSPDASKSSGGSAGRSGSGGAATGAGGGGTTADSGPTCADLGCQAPATCDDTDPKCVCPDGYEDTNGDGSKCDDIDECNGSNDCDANATCKNTPGSYECTCNAPAYKGDGKTCECATGYTKVGDACLLDDAGECEKNADCANGHCVGGSCCAVACDAPGQCQQLDGTTCQGGTTCVYGKQLNDSPCDDGDKCTDNACFDGVCQVKGGKDCSDSSQCTTDTCDKNTGACMHTPIDVATVCNDNNVCTTDACDAAKGCIHTDNTVACNDNNACTVTDTCAGGLCIGKPMDCSGKNSDCTTGVCNAGTCVAQPKNANGACDDGLDACDATGKCNASGVCVGGNDACGTLATACTTCTSGASCSLPQGRQCTCQTAGAGQPAIIVVGGQCVPDTNECNSGPCVAGATCNDPTPNGSKTGDFTCTCPAGLTGDGKKTGTGCSDIDECANGANPCGPGVAVGGCHGISNPPGKYSCTCAAGYVAVPKGNGQECVCDLGGTYAMVATSTLTWNAIAAGSAGDAIEASPPAGVTTTAWSLRYHKVNADGTMTVTTVPCGATTPDICDTALDFAHAQFQPNGTWGKAKVNAGFPTVTGSLSGVIPGAGHAYNEPQTTALMGISLANPSGPWPPCRQCVGVPAGQQCTCPGSATPYTVTNFAQWVDADEDSKSGVTTLDVPRGGLAMTGAATDPPYDYTQPTECPRLATPPGGYGYSEWPGLDTNGAGFRAYRWYVASRVISTVKGSTITFDNAAKQCVVSGTIVGPGTNGQMQTDGRIQSCERCSDFNFTGCTPIGACTDPQADSYDKVSQSQQLKSVSFAWHNLTSSIDIGPILALTNAAQKEAQLNQACDEVRASFCPAGRTCAP